MIRNISLFVSVFLIICSCCDLQAYSGDVHYVLNEKVAKSYNDNGTDIWPSRLNSFLQNNLGISEGINALIKNNNKTKEIWKWLAYGGEAEDFGKSNHFLFKNIQTRAYNHFHDPLKSWDTAGLDDNRSNHIYNNHYGRDPVSAILWGLEPGRQSFTRNTTGDWSWGKAREYYYTYLTGKNLAGDTVALTQVEREAAFADCFRAVGQVMHLLEDMSVPLHTRNDVHVYPVLGMGRWTYETYTKENIDKDMLDFTPDQLGDKPHPDLLTDPQPDSNYFNITPISGLFDRNEYKIGDPIPPSDAKIGLAEYSNANFLTNDTLWTYQHPSLNETNYDPAHWPDTELIVANDDVEDIRIYYRKTAGEPIEHFMGAGYWNYQFYIWNMPIHMYHAFVIDEVCFKDYAAKLIPRAVGYSAALLDYFFRGTMDVQAAMPQTDHRCWISGINFEVKNKTQLADESDIEPFENGNLALSYQYTPPGHTEPQFGLVEGSIYSITGADDPVNSDYVSISASFSEENYIPSGSTDISFTLVFKGKLGLEENAVAGKVFSINSSRIAYSYRPGGWPNPSHIYTVFPDGTDKRQITDGTLGEEAFFSPAWSSDAKMLAFENETGMCPWGYNNCYFEPREIVVLDMASGASYPDNVVNRLQVYDPEERIVALFHPSFSPDGSRIVAKAGGSNIYPLVILDVDTGNWHYINGYDYWVQKSTPGENKSSIAWSPQGDKIAYADLEDHGTFTDMDIYTINPDGTEDVKILNDDFYSGDPSWSPDGEQIAFISNRDGFDDYYDIWIMEKDGQNPAKIYSCIPHCSGPSFSPDGSRIVFKYGEIVHSANIDGTGLELIETTASNPSWSSFYCTPPQ